MMASGLLVRATAQESAGHVNPVIAKLAAGKTVCGLINTGDPSLAHARDTARAPVDFIYAVGRRAGAGHRAEGRDLQRRRHEGASGDGGTPDAPPADARAARREPVGVRGYSTAAASFAWGVNAAEDERRADVWPLNPDGDLLAVIMIESIGAI